MAEVHMTEVRMVVRDALLKKSVRDELDSLVVELARIDEQQDVLKDARKPLIERFVTLAGRHIEQDGRSRYWPVSQIGKRVRVTETEATIPLDWDKFMRLISLTKEPGREPEVVDEKVRDTARDVHNYIDYLVLLYEKRRDLLARGTTSGRLDCSRPNLAAKPVPVTEQENATLGLVSCDGCSGIKEVHTYDYRCARERGE